MENKRNFLEYIQNKNADGDAAGIVISTFKDEILIGVTEEHGSDAEVSLDIEKTEELISILNFAIQRIKTHKEIHEDLKRFS